MELEFLRQIYEKISNSVKIAPVAAQILRANGQTDGQINRSDEAKSRFLQFCDTLSYFVNCISSINISYHHHQQHVAIAQNTLVHLYI